MFWTSRLHAKLVIIVLLISVICVFISLFCSIHETNQIVDEQLNIYGASVSGMLATFCIENLISWDYPALQSAVEHIARHDPDILAIEIYHHNNIVASHKKDSEELGFRYKTPIINESLGEKNLLGFANIVISKNKYHAFYMQQIYSLIILGLILGFGDTFLIYLSTKMIIINPIKRVEQGAEIIGKGDFDYQINIKSDDEIGTLAKALNGMTKNLKLSKNETEKHKKHLESKIDELEKFHKFTVDRELRMIDLKKIIMELEKHPAKNRSLKKNSSNKNSLKGKKNCWDFWKCDKETKEKCPAYKTASGDECWLVATDYCPYLKQKFKTCDECPWFKKFVKQK